MNRSVKRALVLASMLAPVSEQVTLHRPEDLWRVGMEVGWRSGSVILDACRAQSAIIARAPGEGLRRRA